MCEGCWGWRIVSRRSSYTSRSLEPSCCPLNVQNSRHMGADVQRGEAIPVSRTCGVLESSRGEDIVATRSYYRNERFFDPMWHSSV